MHIFKARSFLEDRAATRVVIVQLSLESQPYVLVNGIMAVHLAQVFFAGDNGKRYIFAELVLIDCRHPILLQAFHRSFPYNVVANDDVAVGVSLAHKATD